MYNVFRRAELMEDEGRVQFIAAFGSLIEAKAWIKAQEGKYFGPSSYYIV